MAFPTPPNPSNPIPNSPFYYPNTNYIRGEYGPFIVGGGIFIDNVTGTISASGSGPGGVNTILAGTGIFVSPNSGGVVTVTNTGALSLTAGVGIQVVNSGGNYTIINTSPASSSTGTVTSIATGAGLTGGPITSSGTIALAPTGVGPGTYTNPTITVDVYGRVTYAAPGAGGGSTVLTTLPLRSSGLSPQTLSVDGASTLTPGVVQLNDTVTSTSTSEAPTARALKQAYDLAYSASTTANTAISTANTAVATATSACTTALNAEACALLALTNAATAQITADARIPCTAFTAKGAVLAGTGAGAFTSLGVGTNGQVLTACSACVSGLTWTTVTSGGAGTVTSVTAGTGLTGGTITSSGTIALDSACVIPPTAITAKGDLITGTAASTPVALSVGIDGQILTACAACATGLTWTSASAPAIPCSTLVAKGSLVAASAASTPVDLSVGTDGQTLVACAACTSGLTWITPPTPPVNATPTVAGIVLGCTLATNTALGCDALLAVPTGCFNTAVGASALVAVGAGCYNVGVGGFAVAANVTGCHNVGLGVNAARNALGSNNTAVGHNTIFCATGGCNTVFGFEAGCSITTGSSNVIIGPSAQVASPTGSCQLAIGFSLTENWLTGCSNKNIRPGAGILDCAGSAGTAGQVLASNGANAICWTTLSAPANATPTVAGLVLGCTISNNTSLGCNALLGNTSTGNTAVGVNALDASPSGDNNTAVGACALSANTTGVNNTAIGSLALSSTTTGNFNTGVGRDALLSNTIGVCNTVVGYRGGCALSSGNFNVLLGAGAGCSLTTTNSNVAIGAFAGCAATGGCNVFIGVQSGCDSNSGVCNVVIGTYANVLLPAGSCQLAIGFDAGQYWLTGTCTKAIKPGAGIIDCANSCGTVGQYLWTTGANAIVWASSSPSDTRDKEILGPIPTALPVLEQIEPIVYHWKDRETNVAQDETIYGFSAQQLQEVDSVLVDGSDPEHLRIYDRKIVPLLVKAIQELASKVQELEEKLAANG